jgi:hypothetical protein
VFGMGTGVTSTLLPPKIVSTGGRGARNRGRAARAKKLGIDIDGLCHKERTVRACIESKFYGQAERAISTGKLNTLLRLHIRPINQVVFLGPS